LFLMGGKAIFPAIINKRAAVTPHFALFVIMFSYGIY